MKQSMGNGCVNITPNVGYGYKVRDVHTGGYIGSLSAHYSYGEAPDCEISQHVVNPKGSNPEHSRKERLSRSSEEDDEQIDIDAVSFSEAGTAIYNALSPREKICSFEELYKAVFICKRNVMWKDSVAGFVKNGIHFLGFSFRLTDTGKVLQTILHKKISKERRKLRKLVDKVKAGEMTKQHVDECYQAWRSHVDKGNCQSVLSKMDSYYVNLYAE